MLDDGDPGGLGDEGEEEEAERDVGDSHVTGWRSTLLLGTVAGVLHDSVRLITKYQLRVSTRYISW